MIKVGIVGVSGYSGYTALDILLRHPEVRVTYVSANNTEGKITEIWPQLKGRTNLYCNKFDFHVAAGQCDLIFLVVPHTIAMMITPKLLKAGVKVIDLSGDYRLSSVAAYKKWYKAPHIDPHNLRKAIYGLPELYKEAIKKATLVANPGCYPTAALLSLAPIVGTHAELIESIIIDAKSGVSGAGRKASVALSHAEVSENFKAYKVLNHQHAPEIELYLSKLSTHSQSVNFVPHLLPVNRGIHETIYVQLKSRVRLNRCLSLYKK
ncbi:MAG: N-acetyl-gamma-glutamyl-phosphate reductase, partial [Candidatus Omnitrophica bacterium]|nr:N-acetyl-gamma-glutamyl-phosphate reductase [Candidatus Omnitrophota bacterium]